MAHRLASGSYRFSGVFGNSLAWVDGDTMTLNTPDLTLTWQDPPGLWADNESPPNTVATVDDDNGAAIVGGLTSQFTIGPP